MTNTITITGRLAQDPELKFGQSGKAFCNVTIPDQKRTKDQSGQWQDASDTTWFRATVFGDEAEYLAENATKGSVVTITGRLITRTWTGQDGQENSSLEVDFAKVGIVQSTTKQTPAQQWDPWNTPASGGGSHDGPAPF